MCLVQQGPCRSWIWLNGEWLGFAGAENWCAEAVDSLAGAVNGVYMAQQGLGIAELVGSAGALQELDMA